MKEGLSGLNRFNKSNEANNFALKSLGSLLISARVVDIVLSNEHPRFKEVGEYNGIGTIFINPIDPPLPDGVELPQVKPLFSNVKNYPLKNEIVVVITLPSTDIQNNNESKNLYYINSINLWNHPHHNALPNPLNGKVLPESQKKDYTQTVAGSVRRVTDNSTEISLGQTFKERSNIHPLLPFEGDIIYEGRWGNSIRLGSTVNTNNNWSTSGKEGDPIIIIRNGQNTESTDEGWVNIVEDINKDISSIYSTSTQKIPIEVSSINKYSSYKTQPTIPNQYKDNQIILSSGRLLFNSTKDHILLSSAKTINLNSQEGLNFDTVKDTIFQSNRMYLGSKEANEPLLLGNTTVKLMGDFIDTLLSLTQITTSLVSTPVGTPLAPLNAVSIQVTTKLNLLKSQLDTLKSQYNFTI